ncbi:hypothetical protein CFOL_v3_03317 [Cephalotus follicularis]|uniref:Uncharacterized protein n=1 Tax=Cephalotus follicularis TaxID=3775 RepID=A0A1Q3AVK5_CEPFO|nr:hypothetical protein CFOL_v3_03317 [Cephalotus follicularis]
MFVMKFLNNTTQRKNSIHLINVVQGKNEFLRDYLTQFNKESLVVKDLEPSFAMVALNKSDLEGVRLPHDDLVMITLLVEFFTMKRVLVDSRSSEDILHKPGFDQLRIPGFARQMVHPLESIDLSIIAGLSPCQTEVQMTFLVVDTRSPYDAIIGHLGLNAMEAIVSTRHLLVKFLTKFGVGQIRGDQKAARQCSDGYKE